MFEKYANLKIRYKILLLSFTIIIPFIVISTVLFIKANKTGPGFVKNEINGLLYIRKLLAYTRVLQDRRELLLSFSARAEPLLIKNQKILINEISEIDRHRLGQSIFLKDAGKNWDNLKQESLRLSSLEISNEIKEIEKYTVLIDNLLFEVRKIAEQTNLSNDPANSSLLTGTVVNELPNLIDLFSQTRAASLKGTLSPEEKQALAGNIKSIQSLFGKTSIVLENVFLQDAGFEIQNRETILNVQVLINRYLENLNAGIIHSNKNSSAELYGNATKILDIIWEMDRKMSGFILHRLEEEYAGALQQYYIISIISFISIVIFLLLGRSISRSITTPLENAVNLAHLIASGDLREEIVATKNNETGLLLSSMNMMRLEIHNIIGQLLLSVQKMDHISGLMKDEAVKYAENARVMNDFAEETSMSAVDMILSVDSVTSYSESQIKNADTICSMAVNLSNSITGITGSMKNLESQAVIAMQDGKAGAESIGEATEAIAEVNKISEEIKGIIGFITEISQQTDLLALNAAIEAARAGDAGRGFSVVAQEISKLSARTEESVRSIGDLIKRSNRAVNTSSKKVSDIVAIFSKMISSMEDIGRLSQGVMADLEVQNRNAGESAIRVGELTDIIKEINKSSKAQLFSLQEVSISIQSISEQTKEISRGASEISDTSESLGTIINILRKSINNFKIDEGSLISWNESFIVGIPELDEQHKVLFDMLQDIYNCLHNSACVSDVGGLIGKLAAYATGHLRDEEKFLESIGYPDLENHKLMHIKMEGKVVEFNRLFLKEGDLVVYDILQFIANWLIFHIKEEDHKYAEFYKSLKN